MHDRATPRTGTPALRRRRAGLARATAASALFLAVILCVVVLPVLLSPHTTEGDAQTADDPAPVPSFAAVGGAVLTLSLTAGWALAQFNPRKTRTGRREEGRGP